MSLLEVGVSAVHFYPDGQVAPVAPELTAMEQEAMRTCLALGEVAMDGGNPPIGAVLLAESLNASWSAKTTDYDTPRLLGHAEVLAYLDTGAIDVVGDDLSDCTLITTAQPCTTCTPPYAEGGIGKIVFAASREQVFATANLMRPRQVNMAELLRDGQTDTTVVRGFMAEEALSLFALWSQRRSAGAVQSQT